jgi:hypothetical protein
MAKAAEFKKRAEGKVRALSFGEDLDPIANAEGLETIKSAAKMLKVLPGYLFDLMSKEGLSTPRLHRKMAGVSGQDHIRPLGSRLQEHPHDRRQQQN